MRSSWVATSDKSLIRRKVLAAAAAIPEGYVTTYDAIGALIDVMPRQVARILWTLNDNERSTLAWHRVLAKDGSLQNYGNPLFKEQKSRLESEALRIGDDGRLIDFLNHLTVITVLTARKPPMAEPSSGEPSTLTNR